jgi:uncharacterized membrane protein YheB (UPF0754 family)
LTENIVKRRFWEKGNASNLLSFSLLVLGLGGRLQQAPGSDWILAAGLFGFAGGATNWLAVKMLFDRVPLLYGSGVIPSRFRQIRQTIKDLIMRHFFDQEYLERFFAGRVNALVRSPDLDGRLQELLESEQVDQIIGRKLVELAQSPAGLMIALVGAERIRPLVRQFVSGVGAEIAPLLAEGLARPGVEVDELRRQVEELLEAKLEELSPERVKQMMEEVIREHLGWLIVWGNVFGAAIGVAARALGY